MKEVKNGEKNCFVVVKAKCPICGKIIGDCIMKDEKGERNLGYYKVAQSSVCISLEEVNSLPESLCTSKECLKKATETEAA